MRAKTAEKYTELTCIFGGKALQPERTMNVKTLDWSFSMLFEEAKVFEAE